MVKWQTSKQSQCDYENTECQGNTGLVSKSSLVDYRPHWDMADKYDLANKSGGNQGNKEAIRTEKGL